MDKSWNLYSEEEFQQLSGGLCLESNAIINSFFYKSGSQEYGQWISCDGVNFEYRDQNGGLCKGEISSSFESIQIRDANGGCPYPETQNSQDSYSVSIYLDENGEPYQGIGPDGELWDLYNYATR